jgi:hypothetical protein
MNHKALWEADQKLETVKYDTKRLLLSDCEPIFYDELDFMDVENPACVWLYIDGIAFACVDLRSVIGVFVV